MKLTSITTPRTTALLNRLQLSREGMMWLGASIVVSFLGWFKSINVVFLLSYFMLCLLVINAYQAFTNVRRVRVQRKPTLPIYIGEEAIVQLTVTNQGSRAATVIVDDQIAEGTAGWVVLDLAGKQSVSCHARRVFATRGRFPARARVTSGFPIGLISYVRLGDAGEVTVLPALGAIDPDGLRRWIQRQVGASDLNRKVLRLATSDQADVRGVRPYRPGDQLRAIHWRMSAHRREYMVREYDTSPSPDLVLAVEPWLPAAPTPRELENLEATLSLAATIASTWCRSFGAGVTLFVAGDPSSIRATTPSDRGIREAIIPLAHAVGGDAFEAPDRTLFNRSLVRAARVLVSSRSDSPYATLLSKSTGRFFVGVSPEDRPPWYRPPAGAGVGIQALATAVSAS
jgi:uncharacterized protein (DUF58 family)